MKFILEINEKEKQAVEKAGKEVKNVFKKIKNSFQIRVVKTKKK